MSTRFALISNQSLLPSLLGRRLCEWKLAKAVVVCRFLEELRPHSADVLILDMETAEGRTHELLIQTSKRAGHAKLVMLAGCRAGYLAHLAYRLGVRAILHKGDSLFDFREGLRVVIAGGMFISPLVDQGRRALFARILSEREIAVMAGLALGETNAALAAHLSISAETVRTHRRNCMRKVGATSVLELTRFAISQGVVRWSR